MEKLGEGMKRVKNPVVYSLWVVLIHSYGHFRPGELWTSIRDEIISSSVLVEEGQVYETA